MYYGTIPDGCIRLDAETVTEKFRALTPWMSAAEAIGHVWGFVFLSSLIGNFRCRLTIQTAADPDSPNSPVAGLVADNNQIGTAGETNGRIYNFDPTVAGNGGVGAAGAFAGNGCFWRIGILYSCSAAGTGQGEVSWKGLAWR